MEASVILNAADLKAEELATTAKKILDSPKKFYLLSASLNMKLCNVIDSLSKTLKDRAALTCVRFAYNIYFELETEICFGDNEEALKVYSLAELLDKIEFDENLILRREDYHIVINDDDVEPEKADKAVAKLFQQTVFLNLNIDIKKKSRRPPLKIAILGSRKAGKSVVINCLMKRDYAPTSAVLPTPNVIKYIPADAKSDLILEYKGEKKSFDSAENLSDFIGREFEEAQNHTGEGSGLADMIIHYPCDDLSGYEIWDTPGPNFAGAGDEHQKIAEECILAADVCIFVMNYSNHLTNDEVKFLKVIREVLEENNKLNSLIFVVNRIDERYAAEVEKSVNRILDYISGRLEELGYKDSIIFGTSALQSFYLDKVLAILKDLDIEVGEDDTFFDVLRRFRKEHREYMIFSRFMEEALKNLEDFHNIEDADAKTVKNFSGIPQLLRYINHIGELKAD